MQIKKKKNQLIILASILALLTITPILLYSINQNTPTEVPFRKESLKKSGYWNLPFIHVNNNWTYIAGNYSWCSGDGSWDNPYLIENITIDASSSPIVSGIWIQNSDDYFIIRNSTIFNAGSSNNGAGIRLTFIKNGKFINNTISDNYRGITLIFTDNCSFIDNNLIDNGGQGIILEQSRNNTIVENTAIGSRYYALYILSSSHNNTIIGNIFNNNTGAAGYGSGIRIQYSKDCKIIRNELNYNDYGIRLVDGSENTNISNNIIENNNIYGVYVDNSSRECVNNLFYNNTFNNPAGINGYDNGTNTQWSLGTLGNYWHDYIYDDLNDDGIGDHPYIIAGNAGSQDDFPIWDDGDSINPIITLNSPLGGTIFGTEAPIFNLTIFDLNLNIVWYVLNETTRDYFFTPTNGINLIPIDQAAWDSFSNGSIICSFFINDTAGNSQNLHITLNKDTSSEEPPPTTPQGIPIGNFYLIFIGIGIISILLVERKKRKK